MNSDRHVLQALRQPGRLIPALERCMQERLAPGRSGWSRSHHLARDLERIVGVTAPLEAVESALYALAARRRVALRMDDRGALWFRRRDP